jgi:hypothetical protein
MRLGRACKANYNNWPKQQPCSPPSQNGRSISSLGVCMCEEEDASVGVVLVHFKFLLLLPPSLAYCYACGRGSVESNRGIFSLLIEPIQIQIQMHNPEMRMYQKDILLRTLAYWNSPTPMSRRGRKLCNNEYHHIHGLSRCYVGAGGLWASG